MGNLSVSVATNVFRQSNTANNPLLVMSAYIMAKYYTVQPVLNKHLRDHQNLLA